MPDAVSCALPICDVLPLSHFVAPPLPRPPAASLFMVYVQQKSPEGTVKSGKLNLVDLAGSEKVRKTNASGQTLMEVCSPSYLSPPGLRPRIPGLLLGDDDACAWPCLAHYSAHVITATVLVLATFHANDLSGSAHFTCAAPLSARRPRRSICH